MIYNYYFIIHLFNLLQIYIFMHCMYYVHIEHMYNSMYILYSIYTDTCVVYYLLYM